MSRFYSTIMETTLSSGLLVVPAAAALLIVGFFLLKPLLTRFIKRELSQEDAAPVPVEWLRELGQQVPLTNGLGAARRQLLLARARELIQTCHWEGCGGLTLTEPMQLVIAAQAALLALELPADAYADLREILVYPSTMVPRRATPSRDPYAASEAGQPIAGEAWKTGTVVVSWGAALQGGVNPSDGHNTILHEFAHILDFRAGLTAPIDLEIRRYDPILLSTASTPSTREVWHKLISDNYTRFCAQLEANQPSVIDDYGATNESEFFAVATEVFFEKPAELMAQYPELYAGLKFFYRQDPLLLHSSLHQAG
ncbi:MAG: zinc-dependent peptidase [Gemmatimonadota bacterium]